MSSSILASLDMSLDDLISKKKKSNPDARPSKGNNKQAGGAGPMRNNRRNNRNRNTPYSRSRGNDDDIMMDLEDEEPVKKTNNNTGKPRAITLNQKKQQQQKGKKGSILSRIGGKTTADTNGTKILVKNLKFDILEADVQELFSTVGKVNKAEIVYDRSGRSKGIARVWFARHSDAEKAIKQYDGRTLDGQAMSITLDNKEKNNRDGLFGTALAQREEGGIKFKVNLGGNKGHGKNQHKGGRGNNNRQRGGGNRNNGESKTAEELDNEMDTYMNDA